LDLRLLCVNRRLVKTLDMWPEFPIVVHVDGHKVCQLPNIANMISMFKRNDRVCKISIDVVPNSLLEELGTTSGPFPALIELDLSSRPFWEDPPTLPKSFLGGSVPRLRSLRLWGIPFPSIGKLLLSTRDLVTLSLGFIPPSEYLSPDSMVTILSALTRLTSLHLIFELPRFWTHGAGQRPPSLTRVVLPALTNFHFSGDSEYLENIVSCIDAPLESIAVTFSELVSDVPLLRDFICRTKILNAPHRADTSFSNFEARISLFQRKGGAESTVLKMGILCDTWDPQLQLPSLVQACGSLLSPFPSLEHLGIYESGSWPFPLQYEHAQWMELLHPFFAVKDLVLDGPVVLSVASALQGLVGEQATGILPALQNIFLKGFQSSGVPAPEGITKFIATRELSGHPVIVYHGEPGEGQ
jgi:hypothetical protein